MLSLYETLKASKQGGGAPDYFAELYARRMAGKLLKGTPPLTFSTSENKLRDWEIRGNDDAGKNLLEITAESQTIEGITWTVDKQSGTVTASGKATSDNTTLRLYIPVSTEDRYFYYSGVPANSNNHLDWYMICWDETANARCKLWDGSTPTSSQSQIDNRDTEGAYRECLIPANHVCRLNLRIFDTSTTFSGLVFNPMLRFANTSADFEPYQQGIGERTENGYIIPLSVNGSTINIPIGNAPLTAGESVSKTSTGINIATVSGYNTISTTLYNKPEMKIKYNR